ncbi:MAG: hypothetical protein H6R18_1116, partial [Proteobacteria bacterium]|nr:hypothetical protein [Pseudomonadota bacterium]
DKEGCLLHAAILSERKEHAAARQVLGDYLEAFPRDPEAGIVRIEQYSADGFWLEGLLAIGKLWREHGDSPRLRIYRAACYLNLGLTEAAANICAAFLPELTEKDGIGFFVAGTLHIFRHEYESARQLLNVARVCEECPDDVIYNLGIAGLAQGDFAEGYKFYAERKRFYRMAGMKGVAAWNGEDLKGKRVLVHWEQGIGDSIQYMRYLPIAAALGLDMVFNAQQELTSLLRFARKEIDSDQLRVDSQSFDCELHLLDLPILCGDRSAEDIPKEIPYLFADDSRTEYWRQRLAEMKGYRIGLAWAGNPSHVVDHFRSAALADLMTLGLLPDTSFISLQLGDAAKECAHLRDDFPVLDLQGEIKDFADTAAIIANLDLVIAVDTSVAHLAGALGKPVWIMLPAWGTDWRWELHNETTPWYPTARLFRQSRPGEWQAVACVMRDALLVERMALLPRPLAQGAEWLLEGGSPDLSEAANWIEVLPEGDLPWVVRIAEHLQVRSGCSTLLRALWMLRSSYQLVKCAYARFLAIHDALAEAKSIWQREVGISNQIASDWLTWAAAANMSDAGDNALSILEQAKENGCLTPTIFMETGMALIAQGRSAEGLAALDKAIELAPRPAKSLRLAGIELMNRGRFDEAIRNLQRAALLRPCDSQVLIAIAALARRLGMPSLASEMLERGGLGEGNLSVSYMLSEMKALEGLSSEAEQLLEGANWETMGEDCRAAYGLAVKALENWEVYDQFLESWAQRGFKEKNDLLSYAWRLLQRGDFGLGWESYCRAVSGHKTSIPSWKGESLEGKHLLVYQDQGAGDLIQFFPLVRQVVERGARVTLAVLPEMVSLLDFQGLEGRVISLAQVDWDDAYFDFSVAQMHLPCLLDTRLDQPKHVEPILLARQSLLPKWDEAFANEKRLKVGVIWAGNPSYMNDAWRSTCLEDWRRLAKIDGVVWVNLQKDIASNQAYSVPEFNFLNPMVDCDDWAKTSSVVAQLDMVISVDSGVAHLAAALGVDTWILLPPRVTDFRWQLAREDCPWYSRVRLYRRDIRERWFDVLDRVATNLIGVVQARGSNG